MDILQLYIQQLLGDNVKPVFSRTFVVQAANVGLNNVINLNFTNEKVKAIICTGLWFSYNTLISPVQVIDTFNQNVFETPALTGADEQISSYSDFSYIQEGDALTLNANNINFKFSLFFIKVYSFNEKA